MLVDYLVDIALVGIGIPDALRIDDHHRTLFTTIQTSSRIDSNTLVSGKPYGLDAPLRILAYGDGAMIRATDLSGFPLVDAEKNVVLIIWCRHERVLTVFIRHKNIAQLPISVVVHRRELPYCKE